jgi:7-keto-8-aminopelargonate synthetase-like enzyme
LMKYGLWCPAIRPPTVATARLRIGVNANWNDEDLSRIVAGFEAI